MTIKFESGLLPTGIGSMPQKDAAGACGMVFRSFSALPFWPQLPHRSFKENMYVQCSEGFPGVSINEIEEKIQVNIGSLSENHISELDSDYEGGNFKKYAISRDYAAGLYYIKESGTGGPIMLKGQVTGPVSWGLTVTDENKKPLLYDDMLSDMLEKFLRLKVQWQESFLKSLSPRTLIFLDEPYLASIGSAFVSVAREKVVSLLENVLGGIEQYKGIHCCGNTDWSLLLDLPIDVLSFDAYNYRQALSLYPDKVQAFLTRGGSIAWGIVPNDEASLGRETVASLKDRLEDGMALLARKGVGSRALVSQSLLTPSCGLAGLSVDAAAAACGLLSDLSNRLRKKYSL